MFEAAKSFSEYFFHFSCEQFRTFHVFKENLNAFNIYSICFQLGGFLTNCNVGCIKVGYHNNSPVFVHELTLKANNFYCIFHFT